MTASQMNLCVNIAECALLIYVTFRIFDFLKFFKEHLTITKRYIELIDTERNRLARTLEEKAGEIKQEIRISAAEAKADTKAEIRQSAADTRSEQEGRSGS